MTEAGRLEGMRGSIMPEPGARAQSQVSVRVRTRVRIRAKATCSGSSRAIQKRLSWAKAGKIFTKKASAAQNAIAKATRSANGDGCQRARNAPNQHGSS